jgi:uncharacterized cupin superfamily protein
MSKIEVRKLSEEEKEEMGIESWGVWQKEISTFDWSYDTTEQCYIIEGEAVITDKESGEAVTITKGDFVVFNSGLNCVWDIKEAIKKYYKFV